jgi:hypothetical protein
MRYNFQQKTVVQLGSQMASRAKDFLWQDFYVDQRNATAAVVFVWARSALAPNQIVRTGTN